ncbi:MAG: cysteine hydrolase [Oscillospiraceae bacterium]
MKKTAFVIIDMVYDFTNPQGRVYYADNAKIMPKVQRALEFCRSQNMLIIFVQHTHRANKPDKNLVGMRPNCIEGTGGENIDPRLEVDYEKDYIIKKRRYSAFFGTDLDLVLREHKIENVVMVGTKTNCCVRATVTDAYYLDYNAVVLSDCVCTNSEVINDVHLTDIKKYLGTVLTLEEFEQKISQGILLAPRKIIEGQTFVLKENDAI